MIAFILSYAFTTQATLIYNSHLAEPFRIHPWFSVVPMVAILTIANIPREIHHGREFMAFLFSAASGQLLVP